jgi:hypothetical protein
MTALGRLEQVDLRNAWTTEGRDFTPWLAQDENLRLLGDTLGIELQLEATEKDVGPFRADILCKDTASDAWVLVENQLERTDHLHLGQLLTYAAGLQAVTLVWVARRFTEEHRATLDWLNEITDDRFNFFGLEIELWRIGGSPPAPKFNVVCKPNDWTKTVTAVAAQVQAGVLTPDKQLQLEFWRAFCEYLKENDFSLRPRGPRPQAGLHLSLGRTKFRLEGVASLWDSAAGSYESTELRAEVVIESLTSKAHFDALYAEKEAIEHDVGEPLTWLKSPDTRRSRIYIRRPADIRDRAQWPEQHAWLAGKLELLHRVFAPRVKQRDFRDVAQNPAAELT